MDVLHERCAALDIGKRDLKACVRGPHPSRARSRRQEVRTFATTTQRAARVAGLAAGRAGGVGGPGSDR
jgi:hypothetical protein